MIGAITLVLIVMVLELYCLCKVASKTDDLREKEESDGK